AAHALWPGPVRRPCHAPGYPCRPLSSRHHDLAATLCRNLPAFRGQPAHLASPREYERRGFASRGIWSHGHLAALSSPSLPPLLARNTIALAAEPAATNAHNLRNANSAQKRWFTERYGLDLVLQSLIFGVAVVFLLVGLAGVLVPLLPGTLLLWLTVAVY